MRFPGSNIGRRWALLSERPWLFASWRQFGLVMVAMLVVPSTLILIVATNNAQRRVHQESVRQLTVWGELLSRQVSEEFFGLTRYVASFASRPSLIADAREFDRAQLSNHLRQLAENNAKLSRTVYLDSKGVIVATFPDDPSAIGLSFAHRDWFSVAETDVGATISEVYTRDAFEGEAVVTIAAAIRDGHKPLGYLAAQYRLTDLRAWLRRLVKSSPLHVAISDHRGNAIYDDAMLLPVILADDPAQHDEAQGFLIKANGTRHIASSFVLPELKWRVFVLMPHPVAMRPVNEIRSIILVLSFILLIIFLSIGAVWIKTLFRYAHSLERSNQQLEYFCYSIAHNLRAPLRAIAGFAEITREKIPKTDPETTECLDRISKSAASMDDLVSDLLAFGQTSHADLKLEKLVLLPIIKAALADVREEVQERDADIQIHEPLDAVLGDRALLRQAIKEVLCNAIKFVPNGRRPIVHFETVSNGGCVRFLVRDNGIGIPTQYRDQIYEMFHKLEVNTAGTGVGLSIVRNAVERMGGSITLESTPGEGSIFSITLPTK